MIELRNPFEHLVHFFDADLVRRPHNLVFSSSRDVATLLGTKILRLGRRDQNLDTSFNGGPCSLVPPLGRLLPRLHPGVDHATHVELFGAHRFKLHDEHLPLLFVLGWRWSEHLPRLRLVLAQRDGSGRPQYGTPLLQHIRCHVRRGGFRDEELELYEHSSHCYRDRVAVEGWPERVSGGARECQDV